MPLMTHTIDMISGQTFSLTEMIVYWLANMISALGFLYGCNTYHMDDHKVASAKVYMVITLIAHHLATQIITKMRKSTKN
jgi:hypothetical protein